MKNDKPITGAACSRNNMITCKSCGKPYDNVLDEKDPMCDACETIASKARPCIVCGKKKVTNESTEPCLCLDCMRLLKIVSL
jgi:hypothetical protein